MNDYTETKWVRREEGGMRVRGWSLVHVSTGFILGMIEPFRGGGVSGKKGWWLNVEKHYQRVKTKQEAVEIIKSLKGIGEFE